MEDKTHWSEVMLPVMGVFYAFAVFAAAIMALTVPNDPLNFWFPSTTSGAETWRNIGLMFVGVVGLPFIVWRTITAHKQSNTANAHLELTVRGHSIDRFQQAAHLLNSDVLPIRVAGITKFGELGSAPENLRYMTIQKILCSFIRTRSEELKETLDRDAANYMMMNLRRGKEGSGNSKWSYATIIDEDITEAFRVFSEIRTEENRKYEKDWCHNFAKIKLPFVALPGYDLSGSAIWEANFLFGIFINTDFSESLLGLADFRFARLRGANFTSADLSYCNFANADLSECNLTKADMTCAKLHEAILKESNFSDTNVSRAEISPHWQHLFCCSQKSQIRWVNKDGNPIPFIPDPLHKPLSPKPLKPLPSSRSQAHSDEVRQLECSSG